MASMCILMLQLFALLSSFLACVFAGEYDFTIEVEAGRMSCFFQEVVDPKYAHMEIDYQVGRAEIWFVDVDTFCHMFLTVVARKT